jgi:biopolymer transport protein ExbD
MKFPRNAKIFRGQLDVAPFAGVFFILVMFLLLATLIYTPGVTIDLPVSSAEATVVQGPRVAVAVDKNGRLIYENQLIEARDLKLRLQMAVAESPEPLTLVVMADKAAEYQMCVSLAELARSAGIKKAQMVTLSRPFDRYSTNP